MTGCGVPDWRPCWRGVATGLLLKEGINCSICCKIVSRCEDHLGLAIMVFKVVVCKNGITDFKWTYLHP